MVSISAAEASFDEKDRLPLPFGEALISIVSLRLAEP